MNLTVTPGIDLNTVSGAISKAQFNLLGQPVVNCAAGTVVAADLDLTSVQSALRGTAPTINYLRNGNFAKHMWYRGTTPTSCPIATLTYRADWWAVMPSGAAVTYERSASVPSNTKSIYTAQINGATGATTVDFIQDLPSYVAAGLRAPITISFWMYNSTGASVTPLLRLDTPDVEDVFTAVTNRSSAAPGAAQPNSVWQYYSYTVDPSAFVGITRGLRVAIRIPTGHLDDAAKSVRFSQCKLELGSVVSAFFDEENELSEQNLITSALMATDAAIGNMASGAVVQSVTVSTTSHFFINAIFPPDDTIPQIGEGGSYLFAGTAITPRFVNSTIRITLSANARTPDGNPVFALFVDAAADSIGAVIAPKDVNEPVCFAHEWYHSPATLSPVTYRVRFGPTVYNGATVMSVNGIAATRRFGGAMICRMTIEEIKA